MIKPTRKNQINRSWHLIDANDQVLGRLSTSIVPLLTGKHKPYFAPNMDCGDHVVVVNCSSVKVSGKKETDKIYQRYSGYQGGLKKLSLEQLREKSPDKIVKQAVLGMLPNNKLRDLWLTRLHLFNQDKHTYNEKFEVKEKSVTKDKVAKKVSKAKTK